MRGACMLLLLVKQHLSKSRAHVCAHVGAGISEEEIRQGADRDCLTRTHTYAHPSGICAYMLYSSAAGDLPMTTGLTDDTTV